MYAHAHSHCCVDQRWIFGVLLNTLHLAFFKGLLLTYAFLCVCACVCLCVHVCMCAMYVQISKEAQKKVSLILKVVRNSLTCPLKEQHVIFNTESSLPFSLKS
jgi:type IV secretory pathway VirB3-like protein